MIDGVYLWSSAGLLIICGGYIWMVKPWENIPKWLSSRHNCVFEQYTDALNLEEEARGISHVVRITKIPFVGVLIRPGKKYPRMVPYIENAITSDVQHMIHNNIITAVVTKTEEHRVALKRVMDKVSQNPVT